MDTLLTVCFGIAAGLLLYGAVLTVSRLREQNAKEHRFSLLQCLFALLYVSILVLLFPVFQEEAGDDFLAPLKSLLISAHTAIRVFVFDEDSTPIREFLQDSSFALRDYYAVLAVVVCIMAPGLTLGIVMSFFRSVASGWQLLVRGRRQTYVFSELNGISLALAQSLHENHPGSLMVFCGVSAEEESSLAGDAAALKAVLQEGEIADFRLYSRKRKTAFFAIGSDPDSNVRSAYRLRRKYGSFSNAALYVFAEGIESEVLFRDAENCSMKLRRIDPDRAFVYRTIDLQGHRLFETARQLPNGEKEISVVLMGLSRMGMEMLKALTWSCQMIGYSFRAEVFDPEDSAEAKLFSECPELMDPRHNGIRCDGDALYSIRVHSGAQIGSREMEETLSALEGITYVFSALEEDAQNLKAAVFLRQICERCGWHPIIQAVTTDSERAEALRGITTYRGTPYDIEFVADRASICTEEVLLNSETEQRALQRHLLWGEESQFWMYEFNYRSSIASAIHQKLRRECGMPGAEKPIEARTIPERDALARLEHCRWSAYMRTEGYRYSGSPDPASRNDLAKLHNCLIPFDQLTEADKRKDDI